MNVEILIKAFTDPFGSTSSREDTFWKALDYVKSAKSSAVVKHRLITHGLGRVLNSYAAREDVDPRVQDAHKTFKKWAVSAANGEIVLDSAGKKMWVSQPVAAPPTAPPPDISIPVSDGEENKSSDDEACVLEEALESEAGRSEPDVHLEEADECERAVHCYREPAARATGITSSQPRKRVCVRGAAASADLRGAVYNGCANLAELLAQEKGQRNRTTVSLDKCGTRPLLAELLRRLNPPNDKASNVSLPARLMGALCAINPATAYDFSRRSKSLADSSQCEVTEDISEPNARDDESRKALKIAVRTTALGVVRGRAAIDLLHDLNQLRMNGVRIGPKWLHNDFVVAVEYILGKICRQAIATATRAPLGSLGIRSDFTLWIDGGSIGEMWTTSRGSCLVTGISISTSSGVRPVVLGAPMEGVDGRGDATKKY